MDNNKFDFKYCAPTEEERKEINSIKKQYCEEQKTETKLERLRKLNASVKNKALIVSLTVGIIGVLIFGFGMSISISDLKSVFGLTELVAVILGAGIGIVGIVFMAIAFPLYKKTFNKGKKQHGEEIIKLSEELLNQSPCEKE